MFNFSDLVCKRYMHFFYLLNNNLELINKRPYLLLLSTDKLTVLSILRILRSSLSELGPIQNDAPEINTDPPPVTSNPENSSNVGVVIMN